MYMVVRTKYWKTRKASNLNNYRINLNNYHWLPLESIHLVRDNREFEIWSIFWVVLPTVGGGVSVVWVYIIGGLAYHWLPLASAQWKPINQLLNILMGIITISYEGRVWNHFNSTKIHALVFRKLCVLTSRFSWFISVLHLPEIFISSTEQRECPTIFKSKSHFSWSDLRIWVWPSTGTICFNLTATFALVWPPSRRLYIFFLEFLKLNLLCKELSIAWALNAPTS